MVPKNVFVFHYIRKGFTLVELLVAIGVMAVILGISMTGAPQSVARLALSDDVFKTELMLRQAQQEGSAVNSLSGNYGGAGIFFSITTPGVIFSFKDIIDPTIIRAVGIGNGVYNNSPIDEKNRVSNLSSRNTISRLCVATSSGSPFYCNALVPAAIPPISDLTISFTRPKQTAHMYVNGLLTKDYSIACIEFKPASAVFASSTKALYVYKNGMITKKASPCK